MTSLYDVLQVEKDSSLQDIKKSYRTLALKYHPDKNQNDPSAADRFKQISHAYQILSDPSKRSAYDRFGESGVNALDNEFASPFVQTVGGPLTIFVAILFFFLFFAAFLMTLAGTAAKLDGANDWSWVHSMFGVWLFDALIGIGAVIHFFGLLSSLKEKNWTAALMMLSIVVLLSMTIAWTALVGINLDRPVNTADEIESRPTWMHTNGPGIAVLITFFINGCVILRHSMHLEAEAFTLSKMQTYFLAATRILSLAMPFTLLILISKKADDSYLNPTSSIATASWFLILSPCFFFSLLRGISTTFSSFVMTLRGAEGWKGMFCKEVISWILGHLLFLVGAGLVGEKLQNPVETTRSWGATLVPWFIIAAGGTLLVCSFLCTFSTVLSRMEDMENEQRAAAGASSPTTEQEPNGAEDANENTSIRVPGAAYQAAPDTGDVHNNSTSSADSNTPIILAGNNNHNNSSYGSNEDQ